MKMEVDLPNSRIIFVDFRDSFSHNILSYLKTWGEVLVIDPIEANTFLKTDNRFIWGPGPGRADEYGIDQSLLIDSLNNSEHRHFGICLGHQLLGLTLGGYYSKEKFPRHGVAQEITLPVWPDWGFKGEQATVQSYNSLTIEIASSDTLRIWRQNDVVVMMATATMISMQFHPESVGTSCPELFFGSLRQNFL